MASTAPTLIATEQELVDALRDRADAMRISYAEIDSLTGMPDGYASKVLAPQPIRRLNTRSLGYYLQVLGLGLRPVEDSKQVERIRARYTESAQRYSKGYLMRRNAELTRRVEKLEIRLERLQARAAKRKAGRPRKQQQPVRPPSPMRNRKITLAVHA